MQSALVPSDVDAGVGHEERGANTAIIEQASEVVENGGSRPLDVDGETHRTRIEFLRPRIRGRRRIGERHRGRVA